MQAIKAVFENGSIRWIEKPPIDNIDNVEVTVLFPARQEWDKMSDEEVMRLLREFTGIIDRDIDYEKEREEYLNEKYGYIN